MARIIDFPKVRKHPPPGDSAQASPKVDDPRSEIWENPITQALYRLLLALIFLTWPILKWFVALDLLLEVLRMLFIGGLATARCLLHFAVVGGIGYMVLFVPPLPRK